MALLRVLAVVVAVAAVAAVGVMVALWPRAGDVPTADDGGQTQLRGATLLEVVNQGPDVGLTPDAVALDIVARLDSGERVTFAIVDESGGTTFRPGQSVLLEELPQPGGETLWLIRDVRRGRALLVLALVFVVGVVAFGRWSGVRAIVGLALSLFVVLAFVVPAILAGSDPVVVALAGGVGIVLVTLYLAHGLSAHTTVAAAGTLAALLVTVLLAALSVRAATLTGLATEGAVNATVVVGGVDLRGLLLAGIILGVLGVLDDVTVAQASTVEALVATDPGLTRRALALRAMAVGRDHVAATVNTLVLAYAGASLPLLILFAVAVDPPLTVLSSEVVAVEVVRALVGSLGLLVAVPLTTLLAAAVLHGRGAAEPEIVRPWGSHA